jgi:hypothetical protein
LVTEYRGFIPTCQPEHFAELAKKERSMTIRKATPEETEAFYGQGLIIFDQRVIQAYRRHYEEKKRQEQGIEQGEEGDENEADS